MNTIIKICIAGIVLLAIGAWALRSEMTKNAELSQKYDTLAESLRRSQAASAKREAALTSLAQKNAGTARSGALAGASLTKNLAAERPWAETPVPEAVQRDLFP